MIGRVYKIFSKDKIYVGSTIQTLKERLTKHHENYRRFLDGKFHYITSYEVLKDEHKMELIYEGDFENEDALHKMEGEYQRKIDCVNKQIAGRTREEYYQDHQKERNEISKKYYQDHQTERNEINKKYYQDHNEEIKQKKAVPFTCICGSVCRINDKARHERSKKHQDFIGNASGQGQTCLNQESMVNVL